VQSCDNPAVYNGLDRILDDIFVLYWWLVGIARQIDSARVRSVDSLCDSLMAVL